MKKSRRDVIKAEYCNRSPLLVQTSAIKSHQMVLKKGEKEGSNVCGLTVSRDVMRETLGFVLKV